jgi:hypothetical protein
LDLIWSSPNLTSGPKDFSYMLVRKNCFKKSENK